MTAARRPDILMVEDNPADIRLAQEAFRNRGTHHTLNVARDGVEALDYLKQRGKFPNAIRPDLVLLDLNLPRMSGREVLAEIKADPGLMRIPVIVLTTSRATTDIQNAYDQHANCYVVKPTDLDEFLDAVRSIEDFWLKAATLPAD
jgi:chemotaxis family two-component system response regulator Rcp1